MYLQIMTPGLYAYQLETPLGGQKESVVGRNLPSEIDARGRMDVPLSWPIDRE